MDQSEVYQGGSVPGAWRSISVGTDNTQQRRRVKFPLHPPAHTSIGRPSKHNDLRADQVDRIVDAHILSSRHRAAHSTFFFDIRFA